jgi:hypothetical protein
MLITQLDLAYLNEMLYLLRDIEKNEKLLGELDELLEKESQQGQEKMNKSSTIANFLRRLGRSKKEETSFDVKEEQGKIKAHIVEQQLHFDLQSRMVPEEYQTPYYLQLLKRYIEQHQATSLEDAIAFLKDDMDYSQKNYI